METDATLSVPAMTDLEGRILTFICTYLCNNDRPPTQAEINDAFKFSSKNTAFDYLNRLQRKGCLVWTKGDPRSIRLSPAILSNIFEDRVMGMLRGIYGATDGASDVLTFQTTFTIFDHLDKIRQTYKWCLSEINLAKEDVDVTETVNS